MSHHKVIKFVNCWSIFEETVSKKDNINLKSLTSSAKQLQYVLRLHLVVTWLGLVRKLRRKFSRENASTNLAIELMVEKFEETGRRIKIS